MSIIIFSATGCVRCRVVKQFLKERGLTFQDHDVFEIIALTMRWATARQRSDPFIRTTAKKYIAVRRALSFPFIVTMKSSGRDCRRWRRI